MAWFVLQNGSPLWGADPPVSWLPGETAQQRDARMAWWREAKFGMFIHWGIYSIPADGEWHMRKHQKLFAEYSKYAAQFNPVKFDADRWMGLAHDAGMKYVVITTKHHDGFAMFKSQASAYNIVDATPLARDVVKELSGACPRHGIRFGTYYSFLADWGHKGGGAGCPHWDKAFQDGDLHAYVKTVALPQLNELMTNYGPIAVVWFDSDGSQGIRPEESAQVVEILKKQPHAIVDPRLPGVKGDFTTAEQHMPALPPKGDWELCGTVNGAWGYTHWPVKPLKTLLPYMITAWGMGGNVLMNVGPTPEGIIPEDSAARLREIGEWLTIYGESIYGTTAGPFRYLPWGTATRKGDTLYLHVFQWPADGKLKVPLENAVQQATLLGPKGGQAVKTVREPGRLVLQLPATAPDPVASVIAIKLDGPPRTDYVSVLLNKPVRASTEQKTATMAVDDDSGTRWRNAAPTGWLEIDAGKPVVVATLRVSPAYCNIKNFALEYKQGGAWKPILVNEKLAGDCFVKDFAPVTAQVFRLNILESDKPPQISNLELYPPL
jgi:alpha-L-fucosidase